MSHKLNLGKVVATPAALDALRESGEEVAVYVARHAAGDWGVVGREDSHRNDEALREGTRLLSAYILRSGVRIWIITEADRSVSTVLLPSDY